MTHCSQGQLEGVADMLWVPLFENSENSEETTRNVAAACLGKLATTQPSRYLPQLHVSQGITVTRATSHRAHRLESVTNTHPQGRLSYLRFDIPLQILHNLMTSFLHPCWLISCLSWSTRTLYVYLIWPIQEPFTDILL